MVWGPALRGEAEIRTGSKTAGWTAAHRWAEYREEWDCWGERTPPPPGRGGLEEAAGAGGSAPGSGCLCWGCVGG